MNTHCHHHPDAWTAVVLADLTPDEYDSFFEADIPYSGATGREAYAPYIATFAHSLPDALYYLGWQHVRLEIAGPTIVVRKGHC